MKKIYVDNGLIMGIDINLDFPFILADDIFADDLLIKATTIKVNMDEFNKVVGTEIIDGIILGKIFENSKTQAQVLQEQMDTLSLQILGLMGV